MLQHLLEEHKHVVKGKVVVLTASQAVVPRRLNRIRDISTGEYGLPFLVEESSGRPVEAVLQARSNL